MVLLRCSLMWRLIISLVLGVSLWPAAARDHFFDFSEDKLHAVPEGFRSVLSGTGKSGDWQVILDDAPTLFAPVSSKSTTSAKRRVLAQLSRDGTPDRYPMLVYQDETFDDFTFTTAFKLVAGKTEQMAGVAFRIQDERNYYYIRASGLGTNLSFFKMVNGRLTARVGAEVKIPQGEWHELQIECKGNQFRGRLDGKELLLVTDTAGEGAYASGQIGFWTKSDSVSYFADAHITYTANEAFAQVLIRDALRKYPRLAGLRIYALATNAPNPLVIASMDAAEMGQAWGQGRTGCDSKEHGVLRQDRGQSQRHPAVARSEWRTHRRRARDHGFLLWPDRARCRGAGAADCQADGSPRSRGAGFDGSVA